MRMDLARTKHIRKMHSTCNVCSSVLLLLQPTVPPTDCPSNRPKVVTPTDDVFGQQPCNNDEWQKGTTSFSEPDTQPHRRFPRITVLCTISILFRPSFPCDIRGRVPVTMQLLLLCSRFRHPSPPPSPRSSRRPSRPADQRNCLPTSRCQLFLRCMLSCAAHVVPQLHFHEVREFKIHI